MRELRVEKVTLNIGVGESGEKLTKAEKILERITGRKPIRTLAKKTIRDFGIKRREPIGCKVTLRRSTAEKMLNLLFEAVERRISEKAFDGEGNFSFGVREYIDIPNVEYDPEVGMFGLDVCVSLSRPGYRVKYRRRGKKRIPKAHRVSRQDAIEFISKKFGVQVFG